MEQPELSTNERNKEGGLLFQAKPPAVEECDTDTDQNQFSFLKRLQKHEKMAGRRNNENGTTVDTSRLDTSTTSQAHEELPELKALLAQLKINDESSMEFNLIMCLKKVLTEVIDQNTSLREQVEQLSSQNRALLKENEEQKTAILELADCLD